MKKWSLALLSLLIVIITLIYIFIPKDITVSRSAPATVTQEAALRYLSDFNNWEHFWPGTKGKNKDGRIFYSSEGYNFFLKKVMYNSIELIIEKNKDSIENTLFLVPYQLDSFNLQWASSIHAGNNPYTKFKIYFFTQRLGATLENILQKMSAALSGTRAIYGIDIRKEKVSFEHFLSTRDSFDHYPATAEIYQLIGKANAYVLTSNATQTDYPILNIRTEDSIRFTVQVAIPVDKELPGNASFAGKWMMKEGNILAADVTGDQDAIKKAAQEMERYISDHRRTTIAIPFQMLITDRMKEPDPKKWVTRLYYPVV